MAASAPLSSSFSLYNPQSVSRPSSKPSYHLSLQPTSSQQLAVPAKPISRRAVSSFTVLNAYRRFGNSRIVNDDWYRNQRRSSLKPSDSAQQEYQPHQVSLSLSLSLSLSHTHTHTHGQAETYNEDKSGSESAADKESQPNMKSIMQSYKEAVAYGDARAIYEIENILLTIDKEKIDLADKVSALSEEISSGKEKYIRLQADFDNYRKRSEQEKLTVRSNAQGEVIESLLPMVDSFERAKQQIKIETEMEKKIDTSYQGIYKQFVEIMRSLRVAAVPTVGKPFDPS
ncbi:hypothetical protein C2S51_038190, partial [Perilla frutescens var. frutescens]